MGKLTHQGIGRAVSVTEINYLIKKGLKHSMLYFDADNEKDLGLYTSLGFNYPTKSAHMARNAAV
jgi:ribosomal protein S18 acetylase RimI-like enzyme